ncbi:hypothetical protein HanRHA438_Chr15g0695481 [Helianthus annuus]|nr:hypothetical protein HanRHA438_Chr15g0695481 [Helianthus annuus]
MNRMVGLTHMQIPVKIATTTTTTTNLIKVQHSSGGRIIINSQVLNFSRR